MSTTPIVLYFTLTRSRAGLTSESVAGLIPMLSSVSEGLLVPLFVLSTGTRGTHRSTVPGTLSLSLRRSFLVGENGGV